MLGPLPKNPTLATIIVRVFTLVVKKSGGEVKIVPQVGGKEIELQASFKNGDYTVFLNLTKNGYGYVVTNFSSIEKDSDMGSPYWMPAEWTLAYALKPGQKWTISKGPDIAALLMAHTGWSKLEGYCPVFTWKDNI
jgi:hypothetical protein